MVDRCSQVLADLRAHGSPDFTMLSVAMREIRAMQVPAAGAGAADDPAAGQEAAE